MDFFSTYKLYKQGTAQVVTWLGKTGAQFGYKLALADTTNQQKPSKKIRAKSNGDSSTKCNVTKYTVAELPVLARFISRRFQQTSDFGTLPGILTVLKDVIIKRKEWAKAFDLPGGAGASSSSNTRHKHFVTVLEDVYEILKGAMSGLQQDKGQNSQVVPLNDGVSISMEDTALSNLFAVLDIEEESVPQGESGDQAAGTIRKPARKPFPSRPPVTVTYELEDEKTEDEIDFMIYCFFKDFQAVRTHISKSWADYKSGLLDLVAVAVTTNVALEMLQRAEIVLLDSLPEKFDLFNYQRVAAFLLTAVAPLRGVNPNFLQSVGLVDMDMTDVMDFTSWPVFTVLVSFVILQGDDLRGEHLRVLKPGKLGKIDLTGRPMSWQEKLNQDRVVLYELLPELCILRDMPLPVPYLDELTNGLAEMIGTTVIPMWLVLGCQIYLDIHYTMLSDIGMARRELQSLGRHCSITMQEYLDFSKTLSFDTYPERWMKQGMEDIKEQMEKGFRKLKLEADLWINQDLLGARRKKGLKKLNLPESPPVRPYNLFSRHPMLCGLLLFRLNLNLQQCGIIAADAFGSSLFNVIHLYNAVKHEALEEDGFPLWQDIEAVIRIQGKERLFVGDYPENATEYLKRWSLVTGVSASNFARNRRQGRNPSLSPIALSKRGPRFFIKTSTTAEVFSDQYCENTALSEVTFHKIEKLLSTSSLGGKELGTGSSQQHRPVPFSSVSFLSSLQAHIQSDILALNINFFDLHFRCTSLLRDVSVKLEPLLSKDLGPEDLERDLYLRFLVPHLFGLAIDSEMAARHFKLVRSSEVVRSTVLVEAGELVKALVQKEGDKELQRVRNACRGYATVESTVRRSWAMKEFESLD